VVFAASQGAGAQPAGRRNHDTQLAHTCQHPLLLHHRVLEHNLLDGVAAVKAGLDDAQVAALCAALGARPGDLLLLVGGP
jgi:hypothetical protein